MTKLHKIMQSLSSFCVLPSCLSISDKTDLKISTTLCNEKTKQKQKLRNLFFF